MVRAQHAEPPARRDEEAGNPYLFVSLSIVAAKEMDTDVILDLLVSGSRGFHPPPPAAPTASEILQR
ncbi:hypothetical protein OPT61_g4540 [Boeremia exigua]|uniref:Uncharacterized protein n=1 Tax=Boeremia exigua TaxID=749465 RepID=A0ACC2IDU7_9PLEO|nr:hypothetical protein OPT61_g4540 [Boeremia exigua]